MLSYICRSLCVCLYVCIHVCMCVYLYIFSWNTCVYKWKTGGIPLENPLRISNARLESDLHAYRRFINRYNVYVYTHTCVKHL